MGMFSTDPCGTRWPMSCTGGDKGQGGWFGAKEVRTRGLLLVATFIVMLSFSSSVCFLLPSFRTDKHIITISHVKCNCLMVVINILINIFNYNVIVFLPG